MNDGLPEGWGILRAWLPEDLDVRARSTGFMQRARGLQESETWLRLIFMHVAGGLSLEQTAVRARELQLAKVSGVALFKRLRKAEKWLANLTMYLLEEQRRRLGHHRWPWPRALRVIDATNVLEPGSTGTDLRIHYSLRLPELVCDHYELTDATGGEQLGRFEFAPGEWVLADRGYSHRSGVAHVLKSKAEVIIRWNSGAFPLENKNGSAFAHLKRLRSLQETGVGNWDVWFSHGEQRFALRLCALRKSRMAAERCRSKMIRELNRKGKVPSQEALELAAYILVVTSVKKNVLSAADLLELYRCRWQVELGFKRLKSLLAAGHVPKSDDSSAKAWMQAKILTALLLERILIEARCFSPWGYPERGLQPMEALH
jgi:hypothetical protein